MILLFSRALSGSSAIFAWLHLDHNIGVPQPLWVGCGERLVALVMTTVLRVVQSIGKAGLNDRLTVTAGNVGLDYWMLVLRRRAADDQWAVSLNAHLGAPILFRLLLLPLILLDVILTI